ncbi:general stress protein [Microbacterium gorillae]|uniref:general stress protein n=1 Tax=Microbacterium gorillae TaxID=1231063 RepID=UPI00058D7883|nr:general stress protein [Microbacterium gorillae]
MSMMTPPNGKLEVGERVASFADYTGAQKAVSKLIESNVPARDIAIVGTGLRSIEKVTGKLGYAAAARSGAINGVLLGLLLSMFWVLGVPDAPIQLFLGIMLVGIALGMLLSIISYMIIRRRRDFASVMQVIADHYDVTVQASSIHRAREVLGTAPVGSVAPPSSQPAAAPVVRPAAPPVEAAPPRYGERIPPVGVPEPVAQPEPPVAGPGAAPVDPQPPASPSAPEDPQTAADAGRVDPGQPPSSGPAPA